MLYHREIFMPAQVAEQFDRRSFELQLTRHAKDAARRDRYGFILIPRKIVVQASQIVEAEIVSGEVVKVVVRQPYDQTRDLILVLSPDGKRARVRTVWFNLATDTHATLRAELYASA
jgi:hypothetical protein